MKTIYYLLFVLILVVFSCTKEENNSCSVDIKLLTPEGYATLPFEDMTVVLTNKSQGVGYKSRCSSGGLASFNVECGYYAVSVHYQSASGMIFSGRIETLTLLANQNEIPETVELQLVRSETNALVIKEIYYGGCIGKLDEEYQADQYVTLYNNSDETLYLDGLCIAIVDPAAASSSPWMEYTDMERIPVNDIAWQFPGTGKEHPLVAGAETKIADNAVNHNGGEYQHANSVDLSGVDWGFWDVSLGRQDIVPGVTPMKLISNLNPYLSLYTFPVGGPTLMVFKLEGVSAEDYVTNPDNRQPRPQAANQNKQYLMVPREWVIDCVECVENINQITNKRVPDELNNTPVYMPDGLYNGKSVVRKKVIGADGHIVYRDTNNSTDDFEVSTPLLRR